MSFRNLRTEDYFYCELCWTYKGRPDEKMVLMERAPDDEDPHTAEWIDVHFCKACLLKMLDLLEAEGE